MIHILLINKEQVLSASVRELLNSTELRFIVKKNPEEARLAIERNVFTAAIIYRPESDSFLRKTLQQLSHINPKLPCIVLDASYHEDWATLTYEFSGNLYLSEPLAKGSLRRLLDLFVGDERHPAVLTADPGVKQDTHTPRSPVPALQILRDFSHVLGFSLDYKAFTHHFILKLRDQISFSRIGIFLEAESNSSFPTQSQSTSLKCIASFGLPTDLVDCFQLSRTQGIGQAILQDSRIISACTPAERDHLDTPIRKELEILGCQFAIPVSDREGPIGVAILSGPVTGRYYDEEELQLLYLLMEELGLAIRNSRLHAEVAANGRLIAHVLRSMSSGALVFNEHLDVLYTNAAAEKFLGRSTSSDEPLVWADLPDFITAPVHQAIEKGELVDPFLVHRPDNSAIHRISIIPFSMEEELDLLPQPVMVIIEDYTKIEANKQTAMADTRAVLIRLIAERFAHEIRNALVPLTTHMQLLDRKIDQPAFQQSLKNTLQKETHRIKRFSEQMLYLAQDSNPLAQHVVLSHALQKGFHAAAQTLGFGEAQLKLEGVTQPVYIDGNPDGLSYAFEELFFNSLQSTNRLDSIRVRISKNDEAIVTICIRDDGPGFSEDVINMAMEPFYTSRNTGVGLGLSVAKKIIEEHRGYITLNTRQNAEDWDIKIELPAI